MIRKTFLSPMSYFHNLRYLAGSGRSNFSSRQEGAISSPPRVQTGRGVPLASFRCGLDARYLWIKRPIMNVRSVSQANIRPRLRVKNVWIPLTEVFMARCLIKHKLYCLYRLVKRRSVKTQFM